MRQIIVGIAGRARSGKDVLATALVRDHGFVRYAFADALKEEVAWFLGIDVEELERRKTELRPALQLRGTEYWRARDPRHWIDALARRAAGVDRVVVPDVRFPNEAEWIRWMGGLIVMIMRPGRVIAAHSAHASESGVDEIDADFVIYEPWHDDLWEAEVKFSLAAKSLLKCWPPTVCAKEVLG